MKHLPNALSLARIILAPAMFLFQANPPVLVTLYFLCGITDVLDGFLARQMGLHSAFGAKLDTLGDAVFWAVQFVLVYLRIPLNTLTIALFFTVFAFRLGNLCFTRLRHGQWGILHTQGNKLSGLILFLSLPLIYLAGSIPMPLALAVFLICMLSTVDETVRIARVTSYDPN